MSDNEKAPKPKSGCMGKLAVLFLLLIVGGLANTNWVKSKILIERIGAVLMILIGVYFTYQGLRF